jgi:hypothetical protein
MRRAGLFATLAAGVAFLGASLYGFTSVDRTLKIAAAPKPSPDLIRESQPTRDCDRWERRHGRDV